MEVFSHLYDGLAALAGARPFIIMVVGVIVGILGGAMPGISPSMAVALLLPFTFGMTPTMGIVMLCAIYLAANYGGSITAVIINTPGTPSAVVTAFDGYPLAQQGKAGWGLGISLIASVAGGFIGIAILILFAIPLAGLALKFWPAEYFALALMGLTTVASLGGGKWVESFVAVLLGLLLNTIGMDHMTGTSRFTFDIIRLYDGFSFVPALIGLFAISEVLDNVESFNFNMAKIEVADLKSVWPTVKDYMKLKWTIARAGILGTVIGIFPGAGGTIASFIAYDVEKRLSKEPETFGRGNPHGVAAAESANSSSVSGALVPLLALGIPGSASAAVLVGALMIHELRPGPELFTRHPLLVYTLFSSLLVSNVILLALGAFGSRLWIKVSLIPKRILYPFIFVFSMIGSYAVRSSLFDIGVCFGFGVLGWILNRYRYPVSPIVLGLVLGAMLETNLQMTLMMGGPSLFLTRPISALLLLLSVVLIAWPFIADMKARKKRQVQKSKGK
ncbi:hypothetical protein AGMMS50276_15610 [Synergistales bacterium]|nr:hypothetical protein AGMMS50276_15610 [Synergistales bacterium]